MYCCIISERIDCLLVMSVWSNNHVERLIELYPLRPATAFCLPDFCCHHASSDNERCTRKNLTLRIHSDYWPKRVILVEVVSCGQKNFIDVTCLPPTSQGSLKPHCSVAVVRWCVAWCVALLSASPVEHGPNPELISIK